MVWVRRTSRALFLLPCLLVGACWDTGFQSGGGSPEYQIIGGNGIGVEVGTQPVIARFGGEREDEVVIEKGDCSFPLARHPYVFVGGTYVYPCQNRLHQFYRYDPALQRIEDVVLKHYAFVHCSLETRPEIVVVEFTTHGGSSFNLLKEGEVVLTEPITLLSADHGAVREAASESISLVLGDQEGPNLRAWGEISLSSADEPEPIICHVNVPYRD